MSRISSRSIQPILSLLDEGFLIYRRHFWRFVLIAALWIVPTAIIGGLIINAMAWMSDTHIMLIALAAVVLLLPLMLYTLGSLSRAAHAAMSGQTLLIRDALRIPFRQLLGMSVFVIVYAVFMYIVTSALFIILLCPIYIFGLFGVGLLSVLDAGSSMATVILFGLFFAIIYLFSIAVSGASYSSIIYIIQPWVVQRISFGKAIQQSLELSTYGILRNIGVWMASALMVAALAMIISASIGVLGPLPLIAALGAKSRLAQAGSLAAMLLGMVVVLPPLPIWMALLYRRNLAIRSGAKLDVAIQEWAAIENART